jgi:hypothetical protein
VAVSEEGVLLDRYRLCEPATLGTEGYRLIWFHGTRKAELDADARQDQVARTIVRPSDLRRKPRSPRTRYRRRAKVEEAVDEIVQELGTAKRFTITVEEREVETFRQEGSDRPTERTRYLRQAKDGD